MRNIAHSTTESNLLLDTARRYHAAGLAVMPAIRNGDEKRVALRSWKPFQTRLPLATEIDSWFGGNGHNAVCLAAGDASGNLEMIDFDQEGELYDAWAACIPADLLAKLYIETSPSGGRHVVYRCDVPVSGNAKLAQRKVKTPDDQPVTIKGKTFKPRKDGDGWSVTITLIETRGHGGMFLCAPSDGYDSLQGSLAELPVVTNEERDELLGAAWRLNELMPEPEPMPKDVRGNPQVLRPGDDYIARGDVRSLLIQHGWKRQGGSGDNEYWARPGKDRGHGATFNGQYLYVHSSNAAPFEAGKAYRPFSVYALLEHGGDYAAAARALGVQGFGEDYTGGGGAHGQAKAGTSAPNESDTPVMICMADVEAREVSWLWQNRIPLGRMSLLAGRPGEGKSFLTMDMAARVTRGEDWPDGIGGIIPSPCPKGSVILVAGEDNAQDTIKPRLQASGADCRKVHLLSMVNATDPKTGKLRERPFTLADLPVLEKALQQTPDCKLVIVDPIGSFIGGKTDAHRDNEVRAVLAPVAKLAEQYGAAVLLVAHIRKGSGSHADDLVLGSRAFTGIVRAAWHLSCDKDNGERRQFLPGKNNLARKGYGLAFTITGEGNQARLEWEPDPVGMTADDALAVENGFEKHAPGPAPEKYNAATEWLRAELADLQEHPVPVLKASANDAGLNWRSVERAANGLKVVSQKAGFGGGYIWRLPDPEDDE